MEKHLLQAKHNQSFHQCIEANFKDEFCDWKITVLFYIAIHYLKALAKKRGIEIGDTHRDIEYAVNPDRNSNVMSIKRGAWREYKALYQYSRTARYEGISDMETFKKLKVIDHGYAKEKLENFKKYIESQGVEIDS